MSVKRVDYAGASALLRGKQEAIGELEAAVNAVPVTADGGAASAELEFVLARVFESAGAAAQTLRVLHMIAEDAVRDLAVQDQDIADKLAAFEREVLGE